MLHRLGQGGHLHPGTAAIILGSSPHVDPPTFKAKPACCEAQCSQYSRFLVPFAILEPVTATPTPHMDLHHTAIIRLIL